MTEPRLFPCSICQQRLTGDYFYPTPGRSTGVSSRCKTCAKACARAWNLANAERHAVHKQNYNARSGHARQRERAKEMRPQRNEGLRLWRERTNADAGPTPNRNKTRGVMPPWANHRAIEAMYEQARRRTAETGVEHEIDHIVPINGKTVCGLHVESNLRVVPAPENRGKRNRLVEELIK